MFRAVIMGAPASGKGTISSRITKYFEVNHLSSGDLLRYHIMNKTKVGSQVETYIKHGQLVPDDLMINIIEQELQKHVQKSHWLLDGFPRTKFQAEQLHNKYNIDLVINLVVPFNVIIERTKGRWIHLPSGRVYNETYNTPLVKGIDDVTGEPLVQRPDDLPDAVLKRLEVYSESIAELLKFYKQIGILKDFHGETSDIIWPKVYETLKSYITPACVWKK